MLPHLGRFVSARRCREPHLQADAGLDALAQTLLHIGVTQVATPVVVADSLAPARHVSPQQLEAALRAEAVVRSATLRTIHKP